MKYTHAKCTFDNIELLVFYATFNKNSVISWWSRHIVFAPFLITSPRLLSGDVLLFYYYITPTVVLWCIAVLRFFFTIIITSPRVMYCCSTFLFHYYYYYYYITPTVVGWCIAILRFFFTIIITSPRVMYCYSTFLFSSPGPKVQVNYCHHLASVVRRLSSVNFSHFKLLLRNHLADWNRT